MGATICAREPSAWLADAGKRRATGSLSSTTAHRWMGKRTYEDCDMAIRNSLDGY